MLGTKSEIQPAFWGPLNIWNPKLHRPMSYADMFWDTWNILYSLWYCVWQNCD